MSGEVVPDTHRTAVRRAYERGRAKRALSTALYTAPMVAFSILVRGASWPILVASVAFVGVVFAMAFRGEALGRAVGPGLLAATPPFAVPLVLRAMGHTCAMGTCCMTRECAAMCVPACIAGGVIAGLVIGLATRSERDRPLTMWLGASTVAILAGALGCWFAGLSGVAGMALATMTTMVPVAFARARRS